MWARCGAGHEGRPRLQRLLHRAERGVAVAPERGLTDRGEEGHDLLQVGAGEEPGAHAQQAEHVMRHLGREMRGRCRADIGEVQGRCMGRYRPST